MDEAERVLLRDARGAFAQAFAEHLDRLFAGEREAAIDRVHLTVGALGYDAFGERADVVVDAPLPRDLL